MDIDPTKLEEFRKLARDPNTTKHYAKRVTFSAEFVNGMYDAIRARMSRRDRRALDNPNRPSAQEQARKLIQRELRGQFVHRHKRQVRRQVPLVPTDTTKRLQAMDRKARKLKTVTITCDLPISGKDKYPEGMY